MIASAADGVGLLENAVNLASLVALPTETATLVDIFPEEAGAAGFDSAQFMKKISTGFLALPPEEQIYVARELYDRTKSATPNELQQIVMLLNLLGQDGVDIGSAEFQFGMDKLDVLSFGVAGLASGAAVIKGRKALNALKAMKNAEQASAMSEAVIASDKISSALGASKVDAANSGDLNKVDGILDGADPSLTKDVMNLWEKQDNLNSRIPQLQSEGLGINDAERIAIVEHDSRKAADALEKAGNEIVGTQGAIDATGSVNTKVTIRKPDGTEELVESNRFLTTNDQTGLFKVDDLNPMFAKTTSPNFFFGKDRDVLVEAYERIGYQQAAIRDTLATNFNAVTKGLNRSSMDKLDKVLHAGNKAEKTYSVSQLTTTGINGIVLTNKEAVAYAGTRKLLDDIYVLEDLAMTKQRRVEGLKQVVSKGARSGLPDQNILAKPYAKYQDGVNAYNKDLYNYVKLPSIGEPRFKDKLTPDEIKKWYDEGYQLVRASKDEANLFEVQGTRTVWALSKSDEISELKGGLLPYREGYVPQIGEKEFYFAKVKDTMNIEGKAEASVGKTLATFENKIDAEKWKLDFNKKRAEAGEKPIEVSILPDRQTDDASLSADSIRRMGGLFGGRRSTRSIPHVRAGVEEERKFLNVYEAMQRNISHISRRIPMAEYRVGVEKIWMNSAAQHIDDLKVRNYSFNEAAGLVHRADLKIDPLVKTKLQEAAAQIQYMNNVATHGEEAFMSQILTIGNRLEKVGEGKLGKIPGFNSLTRSAAHWFYKRKSLDPISAIKGGTFHLVLGTMNVAQYFIQASGATIAISMKPLHAASVLPKLPMYTALDNIVDYATRQKAAKIMEKWGKKTGLLSKDSNFADDYLSWNNTGIREGIVRQNVDAANMYGGMPMGKISTQKFMGTLSDASTAPYSAGELINARISYFTALSEMKAANKGKKLTDAQLKQVTARSEKFRLNMNKANKAFYQKGFLAVTTQFMSVNFRFAEAMLGSSFTRGEKLKLLAGQSMLFGTLGVPFVDYATRTMLDSFGYTPDDIPPQVYHDLQEGVVGLALGYGDMENVDVVRRMALGEGFTQQIIGLALDEESPLVFLAGVTAVPGSRAIALWQGILNSIKMVRSADDLDAGAMAKQVEVLTNYILELPSSTRKAAFAWEAFNSRVFKDKSGKPIIFNDNNPLEDAMMVLGFNSREVMDYYEANRANYDMIQKKRDTTKRIIKSWNMIAKAVGEDKQDQVEQLQMFTTGLLSGYTEQDRADIYSAIMHQVELAEDPVLNLVLDQLKNADSTFMSASQNLSNIMLQHAEEVGE